MSFSLKPKNTGGGSDIDWTAINDQVEEGPNDARISVIVDLGEQERGDGVFYGDGQYTVVETEQEASDLIDRAEDILGQNILEKERLDEYEETNEGFSVPFEIRSKKNAQEIAIFADLVDARVDYGEEIGEKQYRVMFNHQFKGELKGFALVPAPPKGRSKLWTFDSKSKLYKLAKATGHKEIISEGEHTNDIGRILGEPLMVNIEKSESGDSVFINAKEVMPLRKGSKVTELDQEAVGITFENATVELLEQVKLRRSVINKIKQAVNYEGSNMQKAVEEYEKKFESNNNSDSEEKEEKPKNRRGRKPKKEKEEPEQESESDQEDGFDDDIPF